MSTLHATLLTLGFLTLFGGPALWWIFYRMDTSPRFIPASDDPPKIMSAADVQLIESELAVSLPIAVRAFLQANRGGAVDGTSVLDTAAAIVSMTQEYRRGVYGLPPWPKTLVYIGDEADACPYALNCSTGEVVYLCKGNVNKDPMARYASFNDFIAKFSQ